MQISPTIMKFLVLSLLSTVWLICYRRAMRLEAGRPYHIAAYRRDRRAARFYFLSVWLGLAAAFLSLVCVEALMGVTFETPVTRDWVLSTVRGSGLWGLLITAMVWLQVGHRASQPDSDAMAHLTVPEERDRSRTDPRRMKRNG